MKTPSKTTHFSTIVFKRMRQWMLLAAALVGLQTAAHAAKVLFVTTGAQRDTTKFVNILKAQGHNLTVWNTTVNGNALTASDYQAQGYQLLIVDEVITSGAVGANFTNSPIPVINWEGFLYSGGRSVFVSPTAAGGTFATGTDAAAANGGGGADCGQVQNTTNIIIVNPSHPLAAGLPAGSVNVFDPNAPNSPPVTDGIGVVTFVGGATLISGATKVATMPDYSGGACIMGVDVGATNYDGVTTNKARWVHLPWNDSLEGRHLIEPSFFLFEAAIAWSLNLAQPTKIYNLLPEKASLQPTNNLVVTFSVDKTTAAGSAVATNNIQLQLNSSNVISSAVITDGGTKWNVAYTNKTLLKDTTYIIVASATAANGGFSARQTQIDTFNAGNFAWEAEDFNFAGGQYFTNVVLCQTIGGGTPGCYFDRVGWTNIDQNETNFTLTVSVPITNEVYRYGAAIDREEFVDTFLTADPLVRTQYVAAGIPDYEVRNIANSEWLNYTRAYPTGYFNIYARVASATPLTAQLDLVTGDTTSTNQFATNKLGRFVKAAGTTGYEMVPLTDDAGTALVTVQFSNSGPTVLQTVRATALSSGYTPNFYMLVPTTAPPNVPPTISLTSPTNAAVLSDTGATITATANDPDGSVTNVQFSAGIYGASSLTVLTNITSGTYSFAWSPAKQTNLSYYIVRAIVTDNRGLAVSTNVLVKVTDPAVKTVTTAFGSGADAQFVEYNFNTTSLTTNLDTSGSGPQLNCRLQSNQGAPTGVHEVVAIRFDLTGYDKTQIQNASVNLMNHRANSAHLLHYYAVKNGATGLDNNGQTPGYTDNTWDETAAGNNATNLLKYSTMPGLNYDAMPTQSYDSNNIVDLGTVTMPSGSVGLITRFSSATLTTFFQTNTDLLVTILVDTDTQSTGQKRFPSKEENTLGTDIPVYISREAPQGTTNWFAPFLSFTLNATPPTLNAVRSTNNIQFSWTGTFKLQSQTNSLNIGIRTNWLDYPGGAASPVNVTISPANPTVFFRLISP